MQAATPASAWQSISRKTENVTMVWGCTGDTTPAVPWKNPRLSAQRDSRRPASRGGGVHQPP